MANIRIDPCNDCSVAHYVQENEQIKLFLQHWEIDSSGNLRQVHNTVDIGSAEQKVRDIYEHDA